VVEQLSKDIQGEYPGIQGFSTTNLWNMRLFYLEIQQHENLQPLVGEISWTKNILILTKCKDTLEREFYMLHVRKFGWTKDVLVHQIENKTYEKYLLNQTNFDQTLPEKYKHQAKLAVKDHYTFDFLELAEEHSEHELEQALVKNIRKFLMEMGVWFTFVGNQFRLTVGEKEYFIDLLLFHRKLKRFIAVELKIGEFKPEYKGKMEFYLIALNERYKEDGENDAIGIIVCKSKDKTVVEYSLKTTTQPIGIATYSTSTHLPEEYSKYLPAPDVIAERLAIVKDLFEDEK
jgi:predicted nuclease of restriction endonuclease-like (RecB) superfamily